MEEGEKELFRSSAHKMAGIIKHRSIIGKSVGLCMTKEETKVSIFRLIFVMSTRRIMPG
jgi:hypothetical protein